MKIKYANLFLLMGIACFLVGMAGRPRSMKERE
jgi:hypothetical protein